jgi:hypothetical protein
VFEVTKGYLSRNSKESEEKKAEMKDPEISMQVRKHIQVSVVKNSACGSLYFGSYTLWKIGFVASPETSQNQVFWVKTS